MSPRGLARGQLGGCAAASPDAVPADSGCASPLLPVVALAPEALGSVAEPAASLCPSPEGSLGTCPGAVVAVCGAKPPAPATIACSPATRDASVPPKAA